MKLRIFLCIISVVIGSISCEIVDWTANLETINSIGNLSKNVTIPSKTDALKVLKEKCFNVSGSEAAYTRVVEAAETFMDCTANLLDIEQLQKEMAEAFPIGELDTVFSTYCRKRTTAMGCLNDLGQALLPCLDSSETEFQRILITIVNKLTDFICYRDGAVIALFISENGPICINENKNHLINCFNSTLHKYIPNEVDLSTATFPHIEIGPEQCNDMNALQSCIVYQFETCRETSPASLVESMFKFVRKGTVCKVH